MGIFDCQISGELTDSELEELRGYLKGQASDGWAKSFAVINEVPRIAQHFALDTSFDERFPHCEYCRKGGLVRSEKACVILLTFSLKHATIQ